tara:strand:- start:439 stop:648 length:210 start_codon:yes stop_codon:yes gene_type:complete
MERRKPAIRCWVCDGIVNIKSQNSVVGNRDNLIIARHGSCAVGSYKWMKSEVAKRSAFYKSFKEQQVIE